jgi:hypothetical protein
MSTSFIAVADSTTRDQAAAADGRLFLATRSGLRAFGMNDGRLLWEASHVRPEPAFYRVPRRIRAAGKTLRPGANGLLCLSDGETDVVVHCHDEASGRVCWERRIQTPPPLPWTESEPACEDAKTEQIDAFLPGEIAGLAVARSSRTSTHSLPGQGTFPAPPYQAQLELWSFEEASGRDRWTATLPDIGIPILEKRRLALLFGRGTQTWEVAAETGAMRLVGQAPKPCAWPRRAGGKAFTAWKTTKGFGLTAFDQHEVFFARKNTREVTLHEAGSRLVLQLNERSFSIVQSDLRVGPEIPIKGYIHGVAVSPDDGLLSVATAGAGGGLYAVDPTSGALAAEHPLPQGAWQIAAVPEAGKAVAVCGPGVAILDTRSGGLTLEELPCAGAIVGVHGRRIAVMTGEPAPAGIHLIDL